MKKVVVGLVILSFMLTGCGKETLSCTSNSHDLGKNIENKIIVTFKGDEASQVVSSIRTAYEQEYMAELDANYDNLKNSFKDYSDIKGVETVLTKEDNVLNVELQFDMRKEEAKANSGFAEYTTKEVYEINLEKSGYECN